MDIAQELRQRILAEVEKLQNNQDSTKEMYRELHGPAVTLEIEKSQTWISRNYPKYASFFANGSDVKPQNIKPALVEVCCEWQADLFRLARYTWSLPYTRGYGRRLRFLVIDSSCDKLIGILGLQSPPLDFAVRDDKFNYPEGRKVELLNQTMDIFTLGAVPPYGRLLGGKLIALAAASDEIREAYKERYSGRKTEMERRELPADLVALTTTSAFGRSSIYNRLRYKDRWIAHGMCQGFATTPVKRLRKIWLDGWVDPHRIRRSLNQRFPAHKTLGTLGIGSG